MKKISLLSLLFVGCSTALADSGAVISKLADYANYSWLKNTEPVLSEETQDLDVRSVNCVNKDLSKYTAEQISFDNGTVFPKDTSKLPAAFDASVIMEKHKNPGLNIRKLHEQGIDGTGVSMAIIDTKLSPHVEYNDNLVYYQEFLSDNHRNTEGEMHGAAVSSIAVGKTVGVAPKAKLYYFAADLADGRFQNDEIKVKTSEYYAAALRKIVEINETLPDKEKIVVVSVSASPINSRNPEIWNEALEKAKQTGVFVTTTRIGSEYKLFDDGVYRFVWADPDDFESYREKNWKVGNVPHEIPQKTLCFPMDHRTTAAPNGIDDYVHYANGGWSWMKPFEAGVYVLAKQVKSDITPEEFFKVGLETGYYSEKAKCVIVNPIALIDYIRK